MRYKRSDLITTDPGFLLRSLGKVEPYRELRHRQFILKPRRRNFHSESSKPQSASAGERYDILIAAIHNKKVRFESVITVTEDFLLLK